jgi:hypothetical protein
VSDEGDLIQPEVCGLIGCLYRTPFGIVIDFKLRRKTDVEKIACMVLVVIISMFAAIVEFRFRLRHIFVNRSTNATAYRSTILLRCVKGLTPVLAMLFT